MINEIIAACVVVIAIEPAEHLYRRIRNWWDRRQAHRQWEKQAKELL